jgi:hypothetical protein
MRSKSRNKIEHHDKPQHEEENVAGRLPGWGVGKYVKFLHRPVQEVSSHILIVLKLLQILLFIFHLLLHLYPNMPELLNMPMEPTEQILIFFLDLLF